MSSAPWLHQAAPPANSAVLCERNSIVNRQARFASALVRCLVVLTQRVVAGAVALWSHRMRPSRCYCSRRFRYALSMKSLSTTAPSTSRLLGCCSLQCALLLTNKLSSNDLTFRDPAGPGRSVQWQPAGGTSMGLMATAGSSVCLKNVPWQKAGQGAL